LFHRILEGGAETGFRHVEPEKYHSRLFHFRSSGKNVVVTQVWMQAFVGEWDVIIIIINIIIIIILIIITAEESASKESAECDRK